MRLRSNLIAVLLVLWPAYSEMAQKPDSIFSKGDQLTYKGYDIRRTTSRWNRTSRLVSTFITVKKGGKVLATFEGCCFKEATRFGLFSFLGGRKKQLVVESYSGGAHCCTKYWIYELSPGFRLLFDGDRYSIDEVGYSMYPFDIDGDGIFEFTQSVMTFDYFYVSHAGSVFPDVVFAYDKRMREFLPANRDYSAYLLRGLDKNIAVAEELNSKLSSNDMYFRENYHSAMLQVILKYIYAGKEHDGWSFFERSYKLSDKAELKRDIEARLDTSVIYKSMNPEAQMKR